MSELTPDVQKLYQQEIMRRSRKPEHARRPTQVDASGVGENPMCGDHVEVFVHRDAQGAIADIGFEAQGCAISVASADMMAELLRGSAPDEVHRLNAAFQRMIETGEAGDDAIAPLRPLSGVHEYRSRWRCATLPWQALTQALASDGASADDATQAEQGEAA